MPSCNKRTLKTHGCNLFIKTNEIIPVEYFKHPAKGFYIDDRMLNLFLPLMKEQKYFNEVDKFQGQEMMSILIYLEFFLLIYVLTLQDGTFKLQEFKSI